MTEITVVLEADLDGTVHLPLPIELLGCKLRVQATIEKLPQSRRARKAGLWKDMPGFWMSPDFDEPLELRESREFEKPAE